MVFVMASKKVILSQGSTMRPNQNIQYQTTEDIGNDEI
jgi:hypothetical protein